MATGATFSTGGKGAHGDLTGVGGPGGLATRVSFSEAPLSTSPARPDPNPLGFTVGDEAACAGAGDLGFVASTFLAAWTAGMGVGSLGGAGVSSACGRVIFVPSVHSIVSGAQSSSSSSISAQFACCCLLGSSD